MCVCVHIYNAVKAPYSEKFLHAVPKSLLSIHPEPHALHISKALHFVAPIYSWYRCTCTRKVAKLYGQHALSCKRFCWMYAKHSEINDISSKSFASANCPVERKPQHLRPDGSGKCTDGVTLYGYTEIKQGQSSLDQTLGDHVSVA